MARLDFALRTIDINSIEWSVGEFVKTYNLFVFM